MANEQAQYIFDAGQFVNDTAKNAAELAIKNAAAGGEVITGIRFVYLLRGRCLFVN